MCATVARPGKEKGVDETSALTRRMLEDYDTVAVVGLSTDPTKAAHSVPAAMKAYGWRVIPVNPHADELLGEQVYRRLADIPEPVEVVNVFRPSGEAADVARQAADLGARAVWPRPGRRCCRSGRQLPAVRGPCGCRRESCSRRLARRRRSTASSTPRPGAPASKAGVSTCAGPGAERGALGDPAACVWIRWGCLRR